MADQPVVTPQAIVSGDMAALSVLVQLLLAERQEQLLEKQERNKNLKERAKQESANTEQELERKRQSQSMCTHRKGGRGLKGPKIDYAVSFHTFVDASSYIRCLICGAKWKNTDTIEYL